MAGDGKLVQIDVIADDGVLIEGCAGCTISLGGMRCLSLSLVRSIKFLVGVSAGSSRARAMRFMDGPRIFHSIFAPMGLLSNPAGRSNRTAGDGFCLAHGWMVS